MEAHRSGTPRPPRNKNFKKKGERPRTWYNCGSASYFVKECPFEPGEEYEGKFVCKEKTKAPQNKNFARRPPRALYAQEGPVLETYTSEDEGEDEVVGVAHIAIATSSSSLISLFESPMKVRLSDLHVSWQKRSR